MAKQYLDRSKVAGRVVDHRSLRSPQRMRAVIFPSQPNRSAPLIHQPGVLPSAEMISMVGGFYFSTTVPRLVAGPFNAVHAEDQALVS